MLIFLIVWSVGGAILLAQLDCLENFRPISRGSWGWRMGTLGGFFYVGIYASGCVILLTKAV